MKCPFCAENIQDAAVLCRFCGAEKQGDSKADGWTRPATNTPRPTPPSSIKGRFTLRSAGVLLILSALLECISITSPVPLFAGLQDGATAIAYHLLFACVFLLMGVGLWNATSWGYRAVMVGTSIYVVDRLIYLFDDAAQAASIEAQLRNYAQLLDVVDLQAIGQMASTVTLVSIACWIGFALYVHVRREYFQPNQLI